MATAVAISPVPPPPFPMATRRVPLANVPNAVNSPRRAAGPTKRPRSAFEDKEDYGNSPVKKKQIIDLTEESHKRSLVTAVDESAGRIFNSATTRAAQNAFTRRLAALKSTKVEEKQERTTHADDETIRQWKRHYRKVFPQFVFYFESIPEDVTQRMSRQILTLGAVCSVIVRLDFMLIDVVASRQVFFKVSNSYCHDETNTTQPYRGSICNKPEGIHTVATCSTQDHQPFSTR